MRDALKEAIEVLLNLPEDKQEGAARAIIGLALEEAESGNYALDIGFKPPDILTDRPALTHREVRHG